MDYYTLVVQTILAVIVGAISAVLTTKLALSNELKKERVKRINEILALPVTEFINRVLELASRAYWDHLDGLEVSVSLVAIQSQDSAATARIHALGDKVLVNEFGEFTRQFANFRHSLTNDSLHDSYNEKQKLEELAGNLLRKLLIIVEK